MVKVVNGKLSSKGILYIDLELFPKFEMEAVVLDFETTSYDEREGEIVCAGFAYKNRATVLVRTKEISREDFYSFLKTSIQNLTKQYEDFYAYNAPYEEKWLRTHLGIPLKVKELMKPAKAITYKIRDLKGSQKSPKLRELLHPRFFSYFGFVPWDIDSGEVPKLWKEHIETSSLEPLELIAQHNLLDILSEMELLLIWNPFMENFLNDREKVSKYSYHRCEVCGGEETAENLAVITYSERKEEKGFRFKEQRVCKNCLGPIVEDKQ